MQRSASKPGGLSPLTHRQFYSNDWFHRIMLLAQLAVFGSLSAFTKDFNPFSTHVNPKLSKLVDFQCVSIIAPGGVLDARLQARPIYATVDAWHLWPVLGIQTPSRLVICSRCIHNFGAAAMR